MARQLLIIFLAVFAFVVAVNSAAQKRASADFCASASGANGVEGSVTFSTKGNKKKIVHVDVNFESGLLAKDGPYKYHVHQKAVPANGDCAGTGDHIDLATAPNNFDCPAEPDKSKCQAGDLSGKHGPIKPAENGSFKQSYDDSFLKFDKSSKGLVGRSIVLHNKNGDRIACASIVLKK